MIISRHKCQWCDLRKPPRLVLLPELRHNFTPHQSTANQYPGLGFKKLRPQASSSEFGALQAVLLIYFQIFSYVKLRGAKWILARLILSSISLPKLPWINSADLALRNISRMIPVRRPIGIPSYYSSFSHARSRSKDPDP